MCGFAALVAGGYWMASTQLNDSLVHPDRV